MKNSKIKMMLVFASVSALPLPLIAAACDNGSSAKSGGETGGSTGTGSTTGGSESGSTGSGSTGTGSTTGGSESGSTGSGSTGTGSTTGGSESGSTGSGSTSSNNGGSTVQQVFKFDQVNDNKIQITAGFSKTNRQGKALQGVVDYYNKVVLAGQGYSLNIKYVSGYNDSAIMQAIEAVDKTGEIGNLTFNYAATASKLASVRMGLDLSDVQGLDVIADSFMSINKKIAGVQDGQVLIIPTSKSTSMLTINLPLLGKILTDLEAKGMTVNKSSENSIINEAFSQWANASEGDRATINEKWPENSFNERAWLSATSTSLRNGFTISDEVFKNWTDYLKFISIVRSYYNVSSVPYIAATDAFPNDFYTRAAQDGVELFPKTNEDGTELYGGFDFFAVTENGTKENKELVKLFKEFYNSVIGTHALKVGGDGDYSSSRFQKHEYLSTIGSSAGLSYNVMKGGSGQSIYAFNLINGDQKIDFSSIIPSSDTKKPSIYTATGWSGDTLSFIDGSHTNQILLSTNSKEAGKYNGKLLSTAQDEILKTFAGQTNFAIVLADSQSPSVSVDSNGLVTLAGKKLSSSSKFVGEIEFRGDRKNLYVIDASEVEVRFVSNSSFVNAEEVKVLLAPPKGQSSDSKNYYVGQGPSLIGIHSNEVEDQQTKEFVRWFISEKLASITIDGKEYNNKTALEVFNEHGNYLSTTKEFFKEPQGLFAKAGSNENLIFTTFKNIVENPTNHVLVEDPGSPEADRVRKDMASITRAIVNNVNDSNSSLDGALRKFVEAIEVEE